MWPLKAAFLCPSTIWYQMRRRYRWLLEVDSVLGGSNPVQVTIPNWVESCQYINTLFSVCWIFFRNEDWLLSVRLFFFLKCFVRRFFLRRDGFYDAMNQIFIPRELPRYSGTEDSRYVVTQTSKYLMPARTLCPFRNISDKIEELTVTDSLKMPFPGRNPCQRGSDQDPRVEGPSVQ